MNQTISVHGDRYVLQSPVLRSKSFFFKLFFLCNRRGPPTRVVRLIREVRKDGL